jgi:hypothetical protein
MEVFKSHTIQDAARWTVAAKGLLNTEWCKGSAGVFALRVVILLGLSSLLLVLRSGAVGGDGALDLGGLSDTLALLALGGVL